jgi:hypothetical protein
MKKTYFQKFIPDKYNFYDPPSKKSFAAVESTTLRKSRSKIFSLMDIENVDTRKEALTLSPK